MPDPRGGGGGGGVVETGWRESGRGGAVAMGHADHFPGRDGLIVPGPSLPYVRENKCPLGKRVQVIA